jgi:hypothetical protein
MSSETEMTAKEWFAQLPLALQVFPRDAREEYDRWEPMRVEERGGLTLPAGTYYVGDVATELPATEEDREDGFYGCDGHVYGKFTTLNDSYKAGGHEWWVDYETFGIIPEEKTEGENRNWINGHTIVFDREFRAGFDAETREFWVEVPGNAEASFRVKLRTTYEDGEDSE